MALDRILEVLVGSESSSQDFLIKNTATKISDLDVSFNIIRTNRPSDNKAKFTIYNAKKETREKVLQEGNNIIMNAGYADEKNIGLVYAGNISEVTTEVDGPDIITHISATTYRGKDKNSDTINVTLNFEPGSDMGQVLDALALLMGFNLRGKPNATSVKLPNGFHYVGSAGNCMRQCYSILAANQFSLVKDNQDMFVFRFGYVYDDGSILSAIEADEYDAANKLYTPKAFVPQRTGGILGADSFPKLTYAGSLLSVENVNKSKQWVSLLHKNTTSSKRLNVNTLLDPRFRPNAGVLIDTGDGLGKYVINKVNHYGSNFSNEFYSKLEVQSLD